MARLLALNALFFLTPFAVYAAYIALTRRRLEIGDWPARVIVALCLAGALIMAVGLFLLTQFSGAAPNVEYRPAVLRDGVIVPGGFEEPQP
jgi:hypothetical protein